MLDLLLASCACAQFTGPESITIGLRSVTALRAADVDGDGTPDLLVASDRDRGVGWFRGRADGSVSAPVRASAGLERPLGMAVRDLDGDQRLDVVVTTRGPAAGGHLFTGLGDGTFEPVEALETTGNFGREVVLADVDGSGTVDVMLRSDVPYVPLPSLLYNLGGGLLAPPLVVTPAYAYGQVAVDLDGDGDLDLVASEQGGLLRAWRNDGGQGFAVEQVIETGFVNLSGMVASDFDGDGFTDVLGMRVPTGELFVYEGRGSFDFVRVDSVGALGGSTYVLELVDVDRDGDLDVLSMSHQSPGIFWFENRGGLDFADPMPLAIDLPNGITAIDLADWDGDGYVDLLTGRASGAMHLLRGEPTASGPAFSSTFEELTARVPDATDSVTLDIDDDGDLDVVVASEQGGLFVAHSIAGSSFAPPRPLATALTSARDVVASDVDGDGLTDLLAIDGVGQLYILWNDGAAGLSSVMLTAVGGGAPEPPSVADVDSDGDMDVVQATGYGDVQVHEQGPGRTFAPPVVVATSSTRIDEVVVIDADLDGDLDLVALEPHPNGSIPRPHRLRLFVGDGTGAFTDEGVMITGGFEAHSLVGAVVAQGQAPNFYWASRTTRRISGTRRTPSGDYVDAGIGVQTAGIVKSLAIGDGFDPNRTDLIARVQVGSSFDGRHGLERFRCNWATAASEGLVSDELFGVGDVELADVDGDGDTDIVVTSPPSGGIDVFFNGSSEPVGTTYCAPAVLNSTGNPGELTALGSHWIHQNDLTLRATQLPPGAAGLFLVSGQPGQVPMAGGGVGTLCLGGGIGRFLPMPGQHTANADGALVHELDLTSFPSPLGPVTPMSNTLWFFQCWYRDTAMGVPTSNFTSALSVVLR